MNLSSLKTSKIEEIVANARANQYPPELQLLPDEINKLAEALPLGEVPTWAKYLHNYKGVLILRINEIDALNESGENFRKELQNEWDYLANLFDQIDKYLQTHLKQEFSEKSNPHKCKFLILDNWQLFGKPSIYA
jgi:hypothetical protein